MAAATVTKTEYGFIVTGDTGAVEVFSGKIWVKGVAFSGNATTATATLVSFPSSDTAAAGVSCMKFKCYDAGGGSLNASGNYLFFGDKGIPLNSPQVTLSNASDTIYIYLVF
jgi:hypothetical protein